MRCIHFALDQIVSNRSSLPIYDPFTSFFSVSFYCLFKAPKDGPKVFGLILDLSTISDSTDIIGSRQDLKGAILSFC